MITMIFGKYASDIDRIYYHNIFNWGQLDGYKSVSKFNLIYLRCFMVFNGNFANGDVPLCNVDYNNKYPTGSIRRFYQRTMEVKSFQCKKNLTFKWE